MYKFAYFNEQVKSMFSDRNAFLDAELEQELSPVLETLKQCGEVEGASCGRKPGEWLSSTYKVLDVSEDLKYQQSGIDRVITRPDGSVITVEYKFDMAAKRTGNLFFETVSNDKELIPGWGWSSQADYWIFLIPEQEIIVFKPGKLRALVWELQKSLKERSVANKEYKTIGYPIPLIQARKVAFQIKTLYLERL